MSTGSARHSPGILETLIFLLSKDTPRPDLADVRTRSWASEVKSYQEVPDVFKSFFVALPPGELDPFPYTVLTPTFKGIHRKPQHEKLISAIGDSIHVLERNDGEDGFDSTSYRLEAISCLESGVLLLDSWITINGYSQDGRAASSTLMFNSVTDHVMAPFIRRIRAASRGPGDSAIGPRRNRFDYLAGLNRKFMSYAERSIFPGESVAQAIYQPAIWRQPAWPFGFLFRRSVSPAHLCILADAEFILLTDDVSQAWLRESPHGAIWFFVPRRVLHASSFEIRGQDTLSLSIHLPGGFQVEALYLASQRDELERLVSRLSN